MESSILILVCNIAVASIFFGVKSYLDYKRKRKECEANYFYDCQELDREKVELNEYRTQVDERERNIMDAYSNMQQMVYQQQQNLSEIAIQKKNMELLINENKRVVKSNDVFLLAIQAEEAKQIDKYKEVAGILSGMIYEGKDSLVEIQKYLLTLNTGIVNMENSFRRRFKMTPNEFKNVQKNSNTDFSLN